MAIAPSDQFKFETIICDVVRHNLSLLFDRDDLELLGRTSRIEAHEFVSTEITNKFKVFIEARVAESQCTFEIIRYASWFDEFKDRYFPQWAKQRWPIQRITVKIPIKALFPKMVIGGEAPRFQLVVFPEETQRTHSMLNHKQVDVSTIDFTLGK